MKPAMDRIKIVVLVLLVLLNPASCKEFSLSDPIICYILDGILIFYCIIATALFFREKLSNSKQVPTAMPSEPNGGIYQELTGPKDADPYEMLQPFKKKREKKRKKSEAVQAGTEAEPVAGTSSSAPL